MKFSPFIGSVDEKTEASKMLDALPIGIKPSKRKIKFVDEITSHREITTGYTTTALTANPHTLHTHCHNTNDIAIIRSRRTEMKHAAFSRR